MKKVVILCPYSYPSACGIWSRVNEDAQCLKSQGYEVSVFSSNIIKGTDNKSSNYEVVEGIPIYRFGVIFSLGGSSMFWNFFAKLREINPDIIHSHGYRHPHSLFSLIWGKLNKKNVVHTTHAPFEKDKNRPLTLKLFDFSYDLIFSWWELKSYAKVIRISKWEEKYLKKLGLKSSEYIPNGINKVFLESNSKDFNKNTPLNRILYMGRIDPIKRPEWIVKAAKKLKSYNFKIWGPLNEYTEFKSDIDNLEIITQKYSYQDFISELSSTDIYVLASLREALPFTLLEAMSQGVFVISSNTNGGLEVIKDGVNGFIVNDEDELVEKIKYIYTNWVTIQSIRSKAVETSHAFSGEISAKKLIDIYNSL